MEPHAPKVLDEYEEDKSIWNNFDRKKEIYMLKLKEFNICNKDDK